MKLRMLALVFFAWVSQAQIVCAEAPQFDLVVYGGTSGGVAAAVQAARMKLSVVIVEPTDHIGGLTTNGLGYTDTGDKRAIGGIAREFYQAVKGHYDQPTSWKHQSPAEYTRYRQNDDAMWTFEPHVAEQIFERWIRKYSIKVIREERLDRGPRGVTRQGPRILSIRLESGKQLAAKMFIDASYEGDLMAAAGVSYAVGRESTATYDEPLNGVQRAQNTHNHRFLKPVDPYRKPGEPSSGLVAGVAAEPPRKDGSSDRGLQAFCYRMCMTRVAANRVPFPKPADYDAARYELLFRNFEAGDLRWPLHPGPLPNGKTDTNNNGAFSTDFIGANHEFAEANYEERAEILASHKSYQQGLMWTLANHPRVPEAVRRRTQQWGLAKDEFVENGNWPRQIYVREARRLVSDYVMTELDCRRERLVEDPVGLGSYNMDSHNVHRYVTPDGFVQNEGDVQVSPGGAYLISYRSIRPRKTEAENLLVPICLSASHIAFGSIRMEPVFMILGQSAATAAAIAIDRDAAVQDVPYEALQKRLMNDGQVLDFPEPTPPKVFLAAAKFAGVVLDDNAAEYVGAWTRSTSTTPHLETGYRHDGAIGQGEKSATFRPRVRPGRYEVRVAYSAHPNRSTRVNVTVATTRGAVTRVVNQRLKPTIRGLFRSLGEFQLPENASIRIDNHSADGYVIVDGVQLIRVKD